MRQAVFGVAALLALAVFCISPQVHADDRSDAQRLYERAQEAYQARNFDDALRLLRAAHALHPEALYAYNVATVLESMGRYAEAHEGVLRVLAHPNLDADLRRLATSRSQRLEALAQHAHLRLRALPTGATVQVDDALVGEAKETLQLDAGAHLLCLKLPEQRLSCWRENLDAGLRRDFPFPSPPQQGRLRYAPDPRVAALALEGHVLRLDASVAAEILLAPRRWRVELRRREGPSHAIDVELLPDHVVELAMPPEPAEAPVEPAPPPGLQPAAPPVVELRPLQPWPWITAGVGALGAGLGGWLISDGAADRDRVRDAGGAAPGEGISERRARAIWEDGNEKSRIGGAVLGVGMAALTAGVSWGLWDWLWAD